MSEPQWQIEARRQYLLTLPGKVRNLQSLLLILAEDPPNAERRLALFLAFHRIEGSAGSYDCDPLGEIAGECASLLLAEEPVTAETMGVLRQKIAAFAQWVAESAKARHAETR